MILKKGSASEMHLPAKNAAMLLYLWSHNHSSTAKETLLAVLLAHACFQCLLLCGGQLNGNIQDLADHILNSLGLVVLVVLLDHLKLLLRRSLKLVSRVRLRLCANSLLEVGFLLLSELLQLLVSCRLCLAELCKSVLLSVCDELFRLLLGPQEGLNELLGVASASHGDHREKLQIRRESARGAGEDA